MIDTEENKKVHNKSDRTKFLEDLSSAINYIKDEIDLGLVLDKSGISNELTELVSDLVKDSEGAVIDIMEAADYIIAMYLSEKVQEFLSRHKDIIKSAYKTFEGKELHYCIVLKEHTLENMEPFFEFQDKKWKKFQSRFPLTFQFIRQKHEDKLTIHQIIKL